MKYPEIWFRGLEPRRKADLEKELALGNLPGRLEEILTSFVREAESVKRSDYREGWAFEQAHRNGEVSAYKKIISLLIPPNQDQRD